VNFLQNVLVLVFNLNDATVTNAIKKQTSKNHTNAIVRYFLNHDPLDHAYVQISFDPTLHLKDSNFGTVSKLLVVSISEITSTFDFRNHYYNSFNLVLLYSN
jgi:hypothetical protein